MPAGLSAPPVFATDEKTLTEWDLAARRVVPLPQLESPAGYVTSTDRARFVRERTWSIAVTAITTTALDPTDEVIALGTLSGRIQPFRVADGVEIHRMEMPGGVRALQFTPDDRLLAASNLMDAQIGVTAVDLHAFRWRPTDLRDDVCAAVIDPLNEDIWKRVVPNRPKPNPCVRR